MTPIRPTLRRRGSRSALPRALGGVALVACGPARAQSGGAAIPPHDQLVRARAGPVGIAAGGAATGRLQVTIAGGWHINANPAVPDYMIATLVEVTPLAGVAAGAPRYPAEKQLKVAFDQSAIAAWDGTLAIELPLAAAADAAPGAHALEGTIRFQACNDQVCLAPATVRFSLPVVVGAAQAGGHGTTAAPPASSAPPVTGFATAPPAPGARAAAPANPFARPLTRGGWAALLAPLATGLLLNLTPCVFPMMGVTVSIFGARRAAPPLQVFGLAVVY